jgi:hypothetical protein
MLKTIYFKYETKILLKESPCNNLQIKTKGRDKLNLNIGKENKTNLLPLYPGFY